MREDRSDGRWLHRNLPGIPEIASFGRGIGRHARVLGEHTHPGSVEICYVERGLVNWRASGRAYDVSGGECYVTRPDEPHGGVDDAIQPSKIYWLILTTPPPSRTGGFLRLPVKEARELARGILGIRRRRFIAPSNVARLLDALIDAPERPRGLALAEARATLVMLLAEVIRAETAGRPAGHIAGGARRAVEIMRCNLERPMSVTEIAERVGWSASHFKAEFRRGTGQTPADYYLRLRVTAALERIRASDSSLAMIAQEFGFSSSQYLSTCVRRIAGRTPSSYRVV